MATKISKRCIGLTMNAIEWKAVEVSGNASNPVVEQVARVDVTPGLMKDGLIADLPAASALLRQLLSGFNKLSPIVVGAKNQNMLMRMASLPKVEPDKMRGMVLYQAQKFIPLPVAELVLDYVECGETMLEQEEMSEVLLVGARKVFLNQIIQLMNMSGRVLYDIDSALLATTRAIIDAHPFAQETFLLVNVDQEGIGVMICQEGTIKLARTVTMQDILEDTLHECVSNASVPRETLLEVARLLANEFQASASYYSTQSGSTVSRAYLRAFFPQTRIVAQEISKILEMPVSVPAPYALNDPDAGLIYATCINLASRGLMEVGK